jgi:hypothetical protein
VHSVNDHRQIELHTTEPLVPEPSPFEFEITTAKLKKYKLSGTDQIRAELIQIGGGKLLRSMNSLIIFGMS